MLVLSYLALNHAMDERIIRKNEMPKMLRAIQNNDKLALNVAATKLILARADEALEMALASAIVCNNLELVRHLVEVGCLNRQANVPRAINLLVETGGVDWYIVRNQHTVRCRVIPPIVYYLSQHFNIPFDRP